MDYRDRCRLLLRRYGCTCDIWVLAWHAHLLLGGLFFFGGVLMFFDRSLYVLDQPSPAALSLYPLRMDMLTLDPDSPWEMYVTSIPLTPHQLTSQILFIIGLTLIIGLQKTLVFFSRPQKLKGTAAFCAGILLILFRWPLTGFLIELYGLFILFGDFLVTIGQFAGNVPVVGPYIKRAMEFLAGGRSNAELPV